MKKVPCSILGTYHNIIFKTIKWIVLIWVEGTIHGHHMNEENGVHPMFYEKSVSP